MEDLKAISIRVIDLIDWSLFHQKPTESSMTTDFTASESPHTVPYKEEWVHCEQLKCKF